MKRIFLVCVAVFTAALVFAQELKFDGYVNYGAGVQFSNRDGESDPRVRAAGVDSEQAGGRFRLNGSYTNADKNAGVNFRFQLQGANAGESVVTGVTSAKDPSAPDPTDPVTSVTTSTRRLIGGNNTYDVGLVFAYGWVRPVEMLQIKAGLVGDSTFETQGPILKDDAGGGAGAGVFVKLTPIEGLDIGVGAYPRSADGSNGNNRITDIGLITDWYKVKYTFGLAYTMPEVFKFNASFRSFNEAGVSSRASARAIGEVQLLMVQDLTAIVEVELDNLYTRAEEFDQFSKTGIFNIYETFAYKMDDLRFGLTAAQYIKNVPEGATGNAALKDIGLRFNPWISYALSEGKIVPRLDAVFFLAGDRASETGSDGYKWDRRYEVAPTYNKDVYVFNVRPSVKINFDSKAALEIGDVVYYRKNPALNKGDGFINNVFYVDLVVRF